MTGSKNSLAVGNWLAGFRIGECGKVEMLTEAEVDVLITRAIREACETLSVKRRLQ
jgi:hypothetical protein